MKIRNLVSSICEALGISRELPFPILQFIENILPNVYPGLTLVILEDEKFEEGDFAFTNPDALEICCRESIYDSAFDGDGFARDTLAHELGHLFLHRRLAGMHRRVAIADDDRPYISSEWQATTFERELMIPFQKLTPELSAREIAVKYKTTISLASVALNKFLEEQKRNEAI